MSLLPNPRYTAAAQPAVHARIVEALKKKIDSYDAWRTAMIAAGVHSQYLDDRNYNLSAMDFSISTWRADDYVDRITDANAGGYFAAPVAERWWLDREFCRMVYGVYAPRPPTLEHLEQSLRLSQFALHPSNEEPGMIAYTASREDGLRDKQVRTTLGKFLRKHFHLFSDAHIQAFEQAYKSDMDPSFKIASVGDEIERVYTQMAGDTGCMRYTVAEHWRRCEVYTHPSRAYEAPGVGVAYMERDGKVIARSVIYQNPDDPNDKRYVRLYGAPQLGRNLQMQGYKCMGLDGVRLKFIPAGEKYPRMHIMPYLDGAAGARDASLAACGVVVDPGEGKEKYVRLMTREAANRLGKSHGVEYRNYQSTEGKHVYSTVAEKDLMGRDVISGDPFDALTADTARVFVGGIAGMALLKTVRDVLADDLNALISVRHYTPAGGIQDAWADSATPLFEASGTMWVDDEQTRNYLGFYKLSAKYGYPQDSWESGAEIVTINDPETDERYIIRKDDRRRIIDEHNTARLVHVSEYNEAKKSGNYVSVSPVGGIRTCAHTANEIVTMPGGKKVIPGHHAVTQLWNGSWEYDAHVRRTTVCGLAVGDSARREDGPIQLSAALIATVATRAVASIKRNYDESSYPEVMPGAKRDRLASAGIGDNAYIWVESAGLVRTTSGYGFRSQTDAYDPAKANEHVAQMLRAAEWIAAATDDQLDEVGIFNQGAARIWAYHAPLLAAEIDRQFGELIAAVENKRQQATETAFLLEKEIDSAIEASFNLAA